MAILTLIRGLPGSGKSTLAKKLVAKHYEADQFFINSLGEYHFDPSKLKAAHRWCELQAERCLFHGEDVVVANTFVKRWEIEPYVLLAKTYDAELVVKECQGKFPNIHGVPQSSIERMAKEWENWPC
ncbi:MULTISPECIES: AAA family ATPase [unclassified Agarivorans]|uniref:AAA family ATPase n=1 Tax=unclassified Agarivorans TaxID=2636026 RepID=UPI003D7E5C07